MNYFFCTGNACNDAERVERPGGRTEAKFRLAVDRDFRNAEGERETDYYTVIATRYVDVTYALERIHRGARLAVTGTLSRRETETGHESVIFASKLEVQP